jgi:ring-1,2-phenylacetyl-CoA epoxidase subunit PaaC
VPVLPDDSPVPAEDALAFFRDAGDFRNVRLVELPRGDYAFTMVRLLAFSGWRLAAFERLRGASDPVLAAVAGKGAKELRYHLEHAARWVVTLAQGTEESRRRTLDAFDAVRPWLPELAEAEPETADEGHAHWAQVVRQAGLRGPASTPEPLPGGRAGVHTPALAELLDEMQSVARAHPRGRW